MSNSFKLNKKILIVSSWAPPMVGGPQHLYNIFSQFPKNTYSIITSAKNMQKAIQTNVRGSMLPCQYYYFDEKCLSGHKDTAVNNAPKNKTSLFSYFLAKPFLCGKIIIHYLSEVNLILLFSIKTMKALKESRTNFLLGISDTGPALIATYIASIITRTPYALYFFDIYKGNNLGGFYNFLASLFERAIMTRATIVIVTNEKTEQFYQQRYGNKIKTAVIHNSAFPDEYAKTRTPYSPIPPYKIVFTGNVYWAQEQSVLNLVSAMELLTDLPIELHLYIPKPTEKLQNAVANKSNIKLLTANQSEMPKIQSDAALLFLPLSWDTKSPDIIATASPGKFTDYLASGRPMLVHAPDYSYIVKYVNKHHIGLIVDQNDTQLLAETMRQFFKKPLLAQTYINQALEIFQQEYDAVKNAQKMMRILNDI